MSNVKISVSARRENSPFASGPSVSIDIECDAAFREQMLKFAEAMVLLVVNEPAVVVEEAS